MNTEYQLDNRERMRELCELAGSQTKAAEMIAEQTMRPCSVESVKSWTCTLGTSRARTCQDWAVLALETRLKVLKKIA
jgi:hypothetical protein